MARARDRLPGDVLIHPAIVASLGFLLLNDLYLKSEHPGPISWKLSDLAGLAFFPALLFALIEITSSLVHRRPVLLSSRWMWFLAGGTAMSFALLKSIPALAGIAERANDIALSLALSSRGPTTFTQDASDLFALPAVLVAVWVGNRWRD